MNKLVRTLGVAALALSVGPALWLGSSPVHAASRAAQPPPACVVFNTPSMVEAGLGPATESSVADVIRVRCLPSLSQQVVNINAQQLSNRCHDTLSWYSDTAYPTLAPGSFAPGPQFWVTLDDDGNANAVVWGGPSCAAGPSLITVDPTSPPFSTATTTFNILPPQNTTPGVFASPSVLVEDGVYSGIDTVIQVEFPSVYAEQTVEIKSPQLFARCGTPFIGGALVWVGPDETVLGSGTDVVTTTLDNNGNAFVVVEGGPSCASGPSLIQADLVNAPNYKTFTTTFSVASPRQVFFLRVG